MAAKIAAAVNLSDSILNRRLQGSCDPAQWWFCISSKAFDCWLSFGLICYRLKFLNDADEFQESNLTMPKNACHLLEFNTEIVLSGAYLTDFFVLLLEKRTPDLGRFCVLQPDLIEQKEISTLFQMHFKLLRFFCSGRDTTTD